MNVELFPFQTIAVNELRAKTAEALGSYYRTHTPQVSFITGSNRSRQNYHNGFSCRRYFLWNRKLF